MKSLILFIFFTFFLGSQSRPSFTLEFTNDQGRFSLGYPRLWLNIGKSLDSFGRLEEGITGIMASIAEDQGTETSGLVSIPIRVDWDVQGYITIFFKVTSTTNRIGVFYGDEAPSQTLYDSINANTHNPVINTYSSKSTGLDVLLKNSLRSSFFMNDDDSCLAEVRLYNQERITSGRYVIQPVINSQFLEDYSYNGVRYIRVWPQNHPSTPPVDNWQTWSLVSVFDDVYVIKFGGDASLAVAINQLNISSADLQWKTYDSKDSRFLWRLTMDSIGRWTIRSYESGMYWSNENDSTLGKAIVLRSRYEYDNSQRFWINLSSKF